jgi:2,3-bisphosphoglycerate-independent phosphoglycerate mutase
MSPAMPSAKTVVLLILDGYGARGPAADNAIALAAKPHLDAVFASYPHTTIGTSGEDVGLPPGQMGNSEVGHLNFGAGRIAMMELSRIDQAVAKGSLGDNEVVRASLAAAKGKRLHLFGLLSDGGVHSSNAHLFALIDLAAAAGVPVVVHAFLDGRDVQPGTAPGFLRDLLVRLEGRGTLGTVAGRFWAMDRDQRWERVEKAYAAIVRAEGPREADAVAAVERSIAVGKTDEFVEPFVVGDYAGVREGEPGLHTNFRPDRARELSRALAAESFDSFDRRGAAPFAHFACMAQYDASLPLPVAFPKEAFADMLGDVVARAGCKQFRCAETEKYGHVTYFFNGGIEAAFEGEVRKLVPSPKHVATYDLAPAMSCAQVASELAAAIESGEYRFVLGNFANCDMVGHTGVLEAAKSAVEAVDAGVGVVVEAAKRAGAALIVTADHGNAEQMIDPASGKPHTAHTTNRVPLALVLPGSERVALREGGRIADVAPTVLELLGLPQPAAMSGVSLLAR